MEEETAVKKVQKFQSGSVYVLISKEAKEKLGLKPRDKLLEKIDTSRHLLIYQRVG